MKITKGSCECGKVQYELRGDLRPSVACHCTQCRKNSGHYWSATQVETKNFRVIKDESLKWYRSSDIAQRAFCTECGSSLFWRHDDEDNTSIGTGSIDGPTGIKEGSHIFVADKGDYYDLTDDLPKSAQ